MRMRLFKYLIDTKNRHSILKEIDHLYKNGGIHKKCTEIEAYLSSLGYHNVTSFVSNIDKEIIMRSKDNKYHYLYMMTPQNNFTRVQSADILIGDVVVTALFQTCKLTFVYRDTYNYKCQKIIHNIALNSVPSLELGNNYGK